MQVILLLVSIAASALAEAPSTAYGAPFRAAPSTDFGSSYQPQFLSADTPIGFRTVGTPFFLPSGQQSAAYYEARNGYVPPAPPVITTAAPTTTTELATTTTEQPTTTESAIELSGAGSLADHRGVYYILQNDGRLQRIAYAHGPAPARYSSSNQQQQNPGFLARFQYQDLEPLGAPIYSYNQPQLVRIN